MAERIFLRAKRRRMRRRMAHAGLGALALTAAGGWWAAARAGGPPAPMQLAALGTPGATPIPAQSWSTAVGPSVVGVGSLSLWILTAALAIGGVLVLQLLQQQRKLRSAQAELAVALDQRTREAALGESRLKAIFDHAPVEIYLKDAEGRYLQINRRFEQLFGVAAADVIGKLPQEVHHGALGEATRAHDLEVMTRREVVAREHTVETKSGVRSLYTVKFPLFAPDDQLQGIGAVVVDITDAKRAETLLHQANQRFQAILDHAPFAIYLKDRKGRYQVVNRYFAETYEAPPEQMIGQDISAAFGDEAPEEMHETDRMVLEDNRCVTLEGVDTKRSSGRKFQVTKFPILNEAGEVVGLGGLDIDVTVRSEAERALKLAKEEAEMASRAKSDFLANMSHEIRTPLNAILGFAELIREEVFGPLGNPRYQEYADDIYRSGKHLMEVIGDILDLSKIEAGKYEVERAPVAVDEVVRAAIGLLGKGADARSLTLVQSGRRGVYVLGDRRAVKQILLNLVSNAIKFTTEGGRIDVQVATDSDGALTLSVADDGVGIADADLARVMEPFTQLGAPSVRRHEASGSGIGLAICKRLAALMRAEMTIESELGVGTAVRIRFPSGSVLSVEDAVRLAGEGATTRSLTEAAE
ncbi:MAG: PAS domain-containing protein [Marivibrio sp.]|uniref:PAS domain-containing protein n=1 Tax=Marivibrio sp. TaxID=2039719 RepID=UPI0032ED3D58